MKVLILGSEGFIGSEIVKALYHSRGFLDELSITGIDIRTNSELDALRMHSEAFYSYVRADLKHTNIAKHADFPDLIINAAATVGVDRVIDNPLETSNNNMSITMNLFEYLIDAKKSKRDYNPYVIFCSSSEVYGNNTVCNPLEYKFNLYPDNERGIYAISKLHEESIYNQLKYYGFDNVLILRLFNIVGETQSKHFVINKFIDSIMNNKTLYVSMNTIRRYCHVDFLSSFICNTVKEIIQNGLDFYGTINFGTRLNDNCIKTTELVYLITSKLKKYGIDTSNARYLMNKSAEDDIIKRDIDYKFCLGNCSEINIRRVIESSKAWDQSIEHIIDKCVKHYLENNK